MEEQRPQGAWLLQLYGTQTHWRGISHLYSGCHLYSRPSSIFQIIDDPQCLKEKPWNQGFVHFYMNAAVFQSPHHLLQPCLLISLWHRTLSTFRLLSFISSCLVLPSSPTPDLSFQFFPAFHLFRVRHWSICSGFASSTISSSSFAPDVVLKIRYEVRNTGPACKVYFFLPTNRDL